MCRSKTYIGKFHYVVFVSILLLPAIAFGSGIKSNASALSEQASITTGVVYINQKPIHYIAKAGSIILHNSQGLPTAKMFYVAYIKKGENTLKRPITFFWNGGPGSSSVWLHMGAFGPYRLNIPDHSQTGPAPYKLIKNKFSLLNVTDEVFVDAVGTGYSRIITKSMGGAGKDADFYGVNADIRTFSDFILRFLSKNRRWNSPKYIFGESYGATRAAGLVYYLERHSRLNLNGVILLSSNLNRYGTSFNNGNDLPYEAFLPTYAAVAWYYKKLPHMPKNYNKFITRAEQFAIGPYAHALAMGNRLSSRKFESIADELHMYTGLPVAYIEAANLRVSNSEFQKELLRNRGLTIGRLDARYSGPSMDPLSETALYDPQSAAISSAFVTGFNYYVRNILHYAPKIRYLAVNPLVGRHWNWVHKNRHVGQAWPSLLNVAVDLANAMKYDPNLKVMVNKGYYDLATPFFATVYTIDHLQIPKSIQSNINLYIYKSGHMVYLRKRSLELFHQNIVKFIRSTSAYR